jgi:Transposase DDE domain
MISLEEFVVAVYCLVDDFLVPFSKQHALRKTGFATAFSDSETLTLLVVGEFLGLDTDKAIHTFFRRGSWRAWFPRLGHRTTFARQSANLWRVMQLFQETLAQRLGAFEDKVHLIDGFPMVVSCITRAKRCRRFRGEAARGFCASKKLKYYGFHGHLVVSYTGVVTACTVTAANVDEREASWEVLSGLQGIGIGDKGYLSASHQENLQQETGVTLWAPSRKNMEKQTPRATQALFLRVRRKIETVIGQLAERFHLERVRARDRWHLTARVGRKLLAHTIGVWFADQFGLGLLEFDKIINID